MSNRDIAFIPLSSTVPSTKLNGNQQLTVLSGVEKTQPFRPLGVGAPTAPTDAHQAACEPRVTIQREGDRVSSIQIQCSCGQVIELGCVY